MAHRPFMCIGCATNTKIAFIGPNNTWAAHAQDKLKSLVLVEQKWIDIYVI